MSKLNKAIEVIENAQYMPPSNGDQWYKLLSDIKSLLREYQDDRPWYTAEELRTYLHLQNYSDEIVKELAEQYAANLQLAFEKGKSQKL